MASTVKGIYMDNSIWSKIKKESVKVDRSVSWMIADILKDYFKKNKNKRARAEKK